MYLNEATLEDVKMTAARRTITLDVFKLKHALQYYLQRDGRTITLDVFK